MTDICPKYVFCCLYICSWWLTWRCKWKSKGWCDVMLMLIGKSHEACYRTPSRSWQLQTCSGLSGHRQDYRRHDDGKKTYPRHFTSFNNRATNCWSFSDVNCGKPGWFFKRSQACTGVRSPGCKPNVCDSSNNRSREATGIDHASLGSIDAGAHARAAALRVRACPSIPSEIDGWPVWWRHGCSNLHMR